MPRCASPRGLNMLPYSSRESIIVFLVRSLVRPDGVMALYTQDGSRTRVVELRVK